MTLPPTVPTADRFLRMAEVEEMTGLRRSQLQQMVREGRFPAPVRLAGEGGRAVGWHGNEVLEWSRSRPRVTYPTPDTEG